MEQHRSVKGEVVDNDNKIVEVNLTHQIKDILLDLNKQLSQEQDEHKNTAEQRNQFKVNDWTLFQILLIYSQSQCLEL